MHRGFITKDFKTCISCLDFETGWGPRKAFARGARFYSETEHFRAVWAQFGHSDGGSRCEVKAAWVCSIVIFGFRIGSVFGSSLVDWCSFKFI